MYTTKALTRGIVALSLVAVLSAYGTAAGESYGRMSDQPSVRQQSEEQMFSPTADLTIRRASQLIGEPVTNPQGEKLGTIYDLVLTPDLEEVSYVALSRGGIFGIGRNLYAVPWDTMRLGAAGAYIAPIGVDELTQWRGFRSTAWPSDPSRSWVDGSARTAEERLTAEEQRSVQDRRVSRIRGTAVETPEGLNAGTLRDMVVATDSGKILYSIVSFGGFFGIGAQQAAVPQAAIDFQPDQRVAQLSVSRETLRANAFPAGRFPDLGDPAYARNINQAYGMEGGGTVLGYVPAGEPAPKPPTPGAVRIDPRAPFDPAAIKTVEGVVTMVGKFAHMESAPDILLLQIRTDGGESYMVHAGPLDYVSKQDFYAVNGDRINVTGAPVREEGRVFLAARISKDGQVLTLRDREGKPLWELSSGAEQRPEAMTHTPEHHMEGSSRE